MKELIIIGAGGFGREIFHMAQNCHGYGDEFVIKGYLDSRANVLDQFDGYPPILGDVTTYEIQPNDVFTCALGDIPPKIKYIKEIQNRGVTFQNLIHKQASINPTAVLGTGLIIGRDVGISCDTRIGNFVTLQTGCLLGHDVQIGDMVHMNARVFLGGGVTVGEGAHLYPYAMVHPRKKIGNFANIGAGSFVINNVKEGVSVFGNPAKKLS